MNTSQNKWHVTIFNRIIVTSFLFVFFSTYLCANARFAFQKTPRTHQKAITYALSGGRFGDNLLAYLEARWLAYKYNCFFLYAPFPYSDQLMLHENDDLCFELYRSLFFKTWVLKNEKDVLAIQGIALIVVPYFPLSDIEFKSQPLLWPHRFLIDWNDPIFKCLIRRLIAPRCSIITLDMPDESLLSVAVHVRRGGNVDPVGSELDFPLKFPPDSFYISAIRKMSELFSHKPMYAYIFTDDLCPSKIMNIYKEALKDCHNIHFDCRRCHNGPEVNVIEDFFSIQKFDCLIRPESNYTMVAEKLKDFHIIISPKDPRIEHRTVVIDTLHITRTLH